MLAKLNRPVVFYILAGIALVLGIILEILGWGALVEGLVVAFGLALLGSQRQVESSLRYELYRGFDRVIQEQKRGFDRVVEELRKPKP